MVSNFKIRDCVVAFIRGAIGNVSFSHSEALATELVREDRMGLVGRPCAKGFDRLWKN